MRPRKSLGQNFLQDDAVVRRIVDSMHLAVGDTVIEIGPGTGALTHKLLETAARVIAIEFDRELIPILNERFSSSESFVLLNEDALNVDFESVLPASVTPATTKLVANLPYNISTPILQRLMDQRMLFSEIVLMFQREVVERITAPAGGKGRGYLSVLVENAFEAEYLFNVPPAAFHPVPNVWSAVVRLVPVASRIEDDKLFRKIVSASFAQKRKIILNNLKHIIPNAAETLAAAGIDAKRRAETLTLAEWAALTENIKKAAL